jgi:type VI secretion system secreted protein Hcp
MRKIINLFFVAAFIFHCSSVIAQSTKVFIIALDGTTKLNGGSTVVGHVNDIEAWSYSQGEAGCFTFGGSCPPSVSDLSFMMGINPATVSFKKLLLSGTFLTSVDLTFRKEGATTFVYYKIRMENVAVTSVQESGSSEAPVFSVSLAPSRIAWQHRAQKADGTAGIKTTFGWDVETNAVWNYVFP